MSNPIVVIGASVDGLVAAILLAKAGRKVVVVEATSQAGGICAGAEFHPGYRHDGIWPDATTLRPVVVSELGLSSHGLQMRPTPPFLATEAEGRGVLLGDAADLGPLAAGYEGRRKFLDSAATFARTLLDDVPPDVRSEASMTPIVTKALALRRLGKASMMEILRVGPTSAEDHLAEWLPSPAARAALCADLVGTWMGPISPQGAAFLMLAHAMRSGQEPVGGPAAVVRALVSACASAGVEIQMDSAVARIDVKAGAVTGVTLRDGRSIAADRVVSSIGTRETWFGLLHPKDRPALATRDVEKVRVRGIFAKVHLAVGKEIRFRGRDRVARAWVGSTPLAHERCFDAAKHGRLPEAPVLDVRIPTVGSPDLAPAGHDVLSISTVAPFALRGGWTDDARRTLVDRVVAALGAVSDLTPADVVGAELVSPEDLHRRFGHEGGHPAHGELALDQIWALRPTPPLARYATPITGLYLASSGNHPGLPGSGGAGRLAAKALLGR